MVIVVRNQLGDLSSNPGGGRISYCANTLGEEMNPANLALAMSKIVG